MVASAELAILISGKDDASKIIDNVAKSFGGLGKAATAPMKALGGLGGALGDVAKLGVGFAAGGLIAQAPGALLDMAKSAAADEQATARLSQTLRNLPGDFDEMTGAVNDAIRTGQKLAFSDDDIRDSVQYLAVATGSHEEALKRQKIAMDLARGASIPLAQAQKLVGKVNEENTDTFKKLGINIKDGATEAEALAAVQAKFAGQAQAYADSTAGQFEQAQIAVDEIKESIGSALLPAMAAVGRVAADNLPAIQEFVGGLATTISGVLGPAIEAVLPLLKSAFDGILAALQPLMVILPDLGTAVKQAFAFFTTGSGDIETFRGVLNKLIGKQGAQAVIEVFTNLSGFVRETVIPMVQSFGDIVGKVMKGDFGDALNAAAKHIATFGPKLVQTLADWSTRFIDWVAPMIPPLLAELGKLLAQVGNWIATVAAPAIGANLLEWGKAFVEWVQPQIPVLLAEAGTLLARLITWVASEALPKLITTLVEWGKAFVAWVGPQIPPLLIELGKIYIAMQTWMLTVALPAIIGQLVEWGKAFLNWVATDVLPKLPGELAKINDAVNRFLIDAATAFAAEAGRTGKALLDGFMAEASKLAGEAWTAIAGDDSSSLKSRLYSGLKDAITNATEGVKKWIDDLIAPFRRAWDTIKGLLDKIRGGKSETESTLGGGGGGRMTLSSIGPRMELRPATITIYNDVDARNMSPTQLTYALGEGLGQAMKTQLISGVR